jgi:hypothetical protein
MIRETVRTAGTKLLEAPCARRHPYTQFVLKDTRQAVQTSDSAPDQRSFSAERPNAPCEVDADDDDRHWAPTSEPYAPAHILLQYIRDGWVLQNNVYVQLSRCFSGRCVEIYSFRLTHGHKSVLMPIIANPAVLRTVIERGLIVVRIATPE